MSDSDCADCGADLSAPALMPVTVSGDTWCSLACFEQAGVA